MVEKNAGKVAQPDPLEAAVDEAIDVCRGDVRAALRATIVANSFLTAEIERLSQAVSVGYTRGMTPARYASEIVDRWREISAGTEEGDSQLISADPN